MNFSRLPVLRHGLISRHEDILPDSAIIDRIETVRKMMQKESLEGLIIFGDAIRSGPVCYLTNYPCYGQGRRAVVVMSLTEGPFLYADEPSRNLPRVRLFTSCNIEKTRRFLPEAINRAKNLSQGGAIGLVGFANLPAGLLKDIEKDLAGLNSKDVSGDFAHLLSAKDESSLKAVKQALELSAQGMGLLLKEVSSGKDLWQLAAQVDYSLRLQGCEDTNIMLGCASGGPLRPGYPTHVQAQYGDSLVAYVAAQFARHWGAVGRSLNIGTASDQHRNASEKLREVRAGIASRINAGMSLGEVEEVILELGTLKGVRIARDLPLVGGIGFDLAEYPLTSEDRIGINTVLQVVLALDFEESSVMLADLLQVTGDGALWLEAGV